MTHPLFKFPLCPNIFGSDFGIFWPCRFLLRFWNMLAIKSIVAPILEYFGHIYSFQPMGGDNWPPGNQFTGENLAVVHFRIIFFKYLP